MGKITCANVLSDLYAMGVTNCDNMLMILGISEKIEPEIREKVVQLIMKGYFDAASAADTIVTGGQTIRNPWFLLGGVASSVSDESEIIRPVNAIAGDVLVLTKPLGTRPAVNAHVALYDPSRKERLLTRLTESQVIECYNSSIESMVRLNRDAAKLMMKYNAHAATDVTGFGIIGHANQLALNQINQVEFRIHTLPVFQYALEVDSLFDYGLLRGTSAETSGGLFVAMAHDDAIQYIKELNEVYDVEAFIIGDVANCSEPRGADGSARQNRAVLAEILKTIEIPYFKTPKQ